MIASQIIEARDKLTDVLPAVVYRNARTELEKSHEHMSIFCVLYTYWKKQNASRSDIKPYFQIEPMK